jgi:hypothetical protein
VFLVLSIPSQRYKDFLEIKHPLKMVTIEPIIDFDLDILQQWIKDIDPIMVWIGYDSRKNYHPEPSEPKTPTLLCCNDS